MTRYTFIPSILLSVVLLYTPSIVQGSEPQSEDQRALTSLSPSQNQVFKITDTGLEPNSLSVKKEDRYIFFLNDSKESLVTLEVNFGRFTTHCSTQNMTIGDDGVVRSVRPIAPKDFAGVCFHDPGTLEFTVRGIKSYPQGIKGSLHIE
jgi:hypothetical protein